jgi:hypothetical protein
MTSKQEIFGAGDLKANEELKNNFSKGTSTGQNILTEDWLKEKTRELVVKYQPKSKFFEVVNNLVFNDRIVCANVYIDPWESSFVTYITFMLADNLVPAEHYVSIYDCIFSEIHVVDAEYKIIDDTIAEIPDSIYIDEG